MVLVDDRVGSREFLARLRGFGIDCDTCRLESADFSFTGNGDDEVCAHPLIGIERKTISDLVSSMRDKRLAGQQHVWMSAQYDEIYLIVEGYWRRGRENGGLLEVPIGGGKWGPVRGRVHYAEVDRFLCSLDVQGAVHVWRTADEEETCAAIADRYTWWQKPWAEHSAMRTIYAPPPSVRRKGHRYQPRREASAVERVLKQMPHIDDERAISLAPYFTSPRDVMEADELRWRTIKGVGPKMAKDFVEWCGGGI